MAKQKQVAVRVTDEEKANIEKKAKDKGLTVSKLFIMLWYRFGDQL